jgi:hypothetical protein
MDPRASLASYVLPLVMIGGLVLIGSAASAQTPEAQTVAREAYAAGVAAFQHGDHAQALVNFAAADEAFPSPNVKLMLGRTLAQLQRRIEAYATLAAAVRDAHEGGPRYDQTASAASEELRAIEQNLAIIFRSPGARLRVQSGRSRSLPSRARSRSHLSALKANAM